MAKRSGEEKREYALRVQHVQGLAESDGTQFSPIDLNLEITIPIELPELVWSGYGSSPTKMKITNSSRTVILSAEWRDGKPHIKCGPLRGEYSFSQLHFHWGGPKHNGSHHTVEGKTYPLEMHVVHYKTEYVSQEKALRNRDGLTVAVYFFQVVEEANPQIHGLVDAVRYVQAPLTSTRITPRPISTMIRSFVRDYLMYWGAVKTSYCAHSILWLVCREPMTISVQQLATLKTLHESTTCNTCIPYEGVYPLGNRSLFHVNRESPFDKVLLKIPRQATQVFCHKPTCKARAEPSRISIDVNPFQNITSCTHLQSPVDIQPKQIAGKHFPPLSFLNYVSQEGYAYLLNNGHTAQVNIEGRPPPELHGGPLLDTYVLSEVHFHWGPNDCVGCEHTIEGHTFSMEAHAVHFRKTYGSFEVAKMRENGLAVVAVFLQASEDKPNPDFSKISSHLNKVIHPHTKTKIEPDALSWMNVIGSKGYYTYPGSLTSLDKSTAVTWIVFPNPVSISQDQTEEFRHLCEETLMLRNYRDIQKMNERPIYFSV